MHDDSLFSQDLSDHLISARELDIEPRHHGVGLGSFERHPGQLESVGQDLGRALGTTSLSWDMMENADAHFTTTARGPETDALPRRFFKTRSMKRALQDLGDLLARSQRDRLPRDLDRVVVMHT